MVKGDHELNRSRCRICKFLKDHRFAKAQWDSEVNKALSLRELETVLRVLGCVVSKSTISRHLSECEHIDLYQTKTAKIKKAVKSPFKKLSNFFVKPTVESSTKCKHERTRHSFDHNYSDREADGLVWVICLDCNEVVQKYDPDRDQRRIKKNPKNEILYYALTRREKK